MDISFDWELGLFDSVKFVNSFHYPKTWKTTSLYPFFHSVDSRMMATYQLRSQTLVAQLEATFRSAHALLRAGLIEEATHLLAALSTEVQPNNNTRYNQGGHGD